jgi:TctA family transporter
MLLSRGEFGIFVTRPISATLLSVISIVVIWQMTAFFRAARKNRNKPALVAEEVAPAAG